MEDHNEQYRAFANHSLRLPLCLMPKLLDTSKRKLGEGRILREKKQYIQVSPFGSLGGQADC